MKARELVKFMNSVIEQHGDMNVNVQTDPESGTSQVTGIWTRIVPVTGRRVLVVCHKNAQKHD